MYDDSYADDYNLEARCNRSFYDGLEFELIEDRRVVPASPQRVPGQLPAARKHRGAEIAVESAMQAAAA